MRPVSEPQVGCNENLSDLLITPGMAAGNTAERQRVADESLKGRAAGLDLQRDGGAHSESGPHPAVVGGISNKDTVITEGEVGPGGELLCRADLLLGEVYGDYPHHGDGCHLDNDIQGNRIWQSYWKRLVSLTFPRNTVPQGKQGTAFLLHLALELDGVREGQWNSERPLVFAAVIL